MTTIDQIKARAATLTPRERQRLGFHWRRIEGGFAAANHARNAALNAQRDDVIRELRLATAEFKEENEKAGGERAAWDASCFRMALAETMLAVAVSDLAGQHGLTQRHIDKLAGPWRHVIGDLA